MWFSDSVHQSLDFQTTMIHCTSTTPPNKAVRLPHSQQKSKSTTTKLANSHNGNQSLSKQSCLCIFTLHTNQNKSLSLVTLQIVEPRQEKEIVKIPSKIFQLILLCLLFNAKNKSSSVNGEKKHLIFSELCSNKHWKFFRILKGMVGGGLHVEWESSQLS